MITDQVREVLEALRDNSTTVNRKEGGIKLVVDRDRFADELSRILDVTSYDARTLVGG